MTIRTADEELPALLRSRIGTEFDGECTLSEAEALQTATLIEQLHNRVERLRGAMIRSGRAAGCVLADSVSDEFLMLVPAEIEAKVEQLVEREARARSGEHQLPRDSDR